MKSRKSWSLLLPLAAALFAQPAAAQVIISFDSVSGVPISPWVNASIGVLLVLSALAFLKRKAGGGVFLLALAAVAMGGNAMLAKDGYANGGTPTPLVISPTSDAPGHVVASGVGSPVCGAVGFVWVTSNGGSIRITQIAYDTTNNYYAFDPATPPGYSGPPGIDACTVGTVLTASTSCIVWYKQSSGC